MPSRDSLPRINSVIGEIDLSRCKPFKDFGRGFYLTSLKDQAEAMARRTTAIEGSGDPAVTAFDPDDAWRESELNVLTFDGPSREWAVFIMNNRNYEFRDTSSPLCNRECQYDVVFGPVADDRIVTSFNLYLDGRIGLDDMVERFRYRKLSDQYSFHTPRFLRLLRNLGAIS